MSGSTAYLDTSAFLKLLVVEAESVALRDDLRRVDQHASSTLLRTETVRTLRRSGLGQLVGPARRVFGSMVLIRLDEPLMDRAGELEPPVLRSLDAVHLAAALSMGSDLQALYTYDQRLQEAAVANGLVVRSPGASIA